jgi:hypothetical protein
VQDVDFFGRQKISSFACDCPIRVILYLRLSYSEAIIFVLTASVSTLYIGNGPTYLGLNPGPCDSVSVTVTNQPF